MPPRKTAPGSTSPARREVRPGASLDPRALIADRDGLARNALRQSLTGAGVAVVGQAADAPHAVNLIRRCKPDVIVMEADLPPDGGLAALQTALSVSPRVRVIMLDASDDPDAGVVALEKGAAGYLSRELDLASIARAVVRVAAGEAAISRAMSARLIERLRSRSVDSVGLRPIKSVLTTREWEVLDLMTTGTSSAEIARALVLSPETVHSHMSHIFRKLHAHSRAEAIAKAESARARRTEHPSIAGEPRFSFPPRGPSHKS